MFFYKLDWIFYLDLQLWASSSPGDSFFVLQLMLQFLEVKILMFEILRLFVFLWEFCTMLCGFCWNLQFFLRELISFWKASFQVFPRFSLKLCGTFFKELYWLLSFAGWSVCMIRWFFYFRSTLIFLCRDILVHILSSQILFCSWLFKMFFV